MRVFITIACEWQDAGRQRPLSVGESYELPDAVAVDLVAMGLAVMPDQAYETKPDPVMLETKPRGARRAAH